MDREPSIVESVSLRVNSSQPPSQMDVTRILSINYADVLNIMGLDIEADQLRAHAAGEEASDNDQRIPVFVVRVSNRDFAFPARDWNSWLSWWSPWAIGLDREVMKALLALMHGHPAGNIQELIYSLTTDMPAGILDANSYLFNDGVIVVRWQDTTQFTKEIL